METTENIDSEDDDFQRLSRLASFRLGLLGISTALIFTAELKVFAEVNGVDDSHGRTVWWVFAHFRANGWERGPRTLVISTVTLLLSLASLEIAWRRWAHGESQAVTAGLALAAFLAVAAAIEFFAFFMIYAINRA